MRQTFKDESFLIFALGTLLVFFILVFSSCNKIPNERIIKETTDNRGFTSVIFVEGKDTLAYDYLTPKEYKQIFKH